MAELLLLLVETLNDLALCNTIKDIIRCNKLRKGINILYNIACKSCQHEQLSFLNKYQTINLIVLW